MEYKPIVSIITVSYNAIKTIENTILSVINQSYTNIEYIIVDGGSTDGTIDIIKKYKKNINKIVSEPDRGIYDAMNKGIELATGEWINFMNCGDTFYSNRTINEVFKKINPDSDIIYGNTNNIYSFGNFLIKGKQATLSEFMPFCHQSSFCKTNILKRNKFNLNYKICADKELFRKSFIQGYKFEYIDITIANYEAELGLSSTNDKIFYYEMGMIEEKNTKINWKLKYYFILIYINFSSFLKKVLPKQLVTYFKKRNLKKIAD